MEEARISVLLPQRRDETAHFRRTEVQTWISMREVVPFASLATFAMETAARDSRVSIDSGDVFTTSLYKYKSGQSRRGPLCEFARTD
jgi:hypothetical protein